MTLNIPAIAAQAELHHQYLLGLELMVATREGPAVVGDWMFRLFRRQHEDKFLSSFHKLGLDGLPDAVACAKYHVLSNGVGGVAVEYMEESDTKAWVRFRYPRWMYDGAVICGVPVEASRGFLRGWYGQNGVSLGNPRLGFVCVSEDMTGQFGLCGYFREYDHDLSEDERLVFAPDERPPPFDPAKQPVPPVGEWTEERLAKANRNYAVEYIRNGVRELANVLGHERALELCRLAARLTGLQHYRHMADAVGGVDGGPAQAAWMADRRRRRPSCRRCLKGWEMRAGSRRPLTARSFTSPACGSCAGWTGGSVKRFWPAGPRSGAGRSTRSGPSWM
ncbi:MAG: hypothetical protein R3B94_14345 [Hyphomonas sp.]